MDKQQRLLEIIEKARLEEWEELYLGYSQLTEVPADIGQLTSLQRLELTANQLTKISADIGKLTFLELLSILSKLYHCIE